MKSLPNNVTALRILGAFCLLPCDVKSTAFWALYALCGISDMVDGWLARKLGAVTKKGALLDSLADFVFVIVVGYKLFPWLRLPAALWMMIGLIALVKVSNAISSYMVKHRIEFLHTKANKLTGFLLFIGVMTIGQSYFIPIAWVIACIALFAAIQEGHFIRSK